MDIQKAQKEQWFAEAIERYQKPLQTFAYGMLKNIEYTQEAVQDTFLRLWKQDMVEISDKLAPWLYTVCRNRALHKIRHEKRYVAVDEGEENKNYLMLPTPENSPAEDLELKEQLSILADARTKLSKKLNEVLTLRYNEGLSYEEITTKTGLKSGNIGFILNEAKRQLRTDIIATAKIKSVSVAKAE
jgi:RNA polymerase sigma-70 factor (ECF subfamily)